MQENKQKKSPIKKNILYFLKHQGITKYKFYQDTGITRGVLDQNTGMSEENTARFIAHYPYISLSWLLTGEGAMFKDEKAGKAKKQPIAMNKDCEFCKLKDQLIAAQSQTIELLEDKLSKCCPQQEECEKNESEAG